MVSYRRCIGSTPNGKKTLSTNAYVEILHHASKEWDMHGVDNPAEWKVDLPTPTQRKDPSPASNVHS